MSYTKEPWEVSALGGGIGANNVPICQMHNSNGVDYPNYEANARRIVACVNACAGISTEQLESEGIVVLGAPIADRFRDLEKQRDELNAELASFKVAVAHVTEDGKTGRPSFRSSKGWAMVHREYLAELEQQREELLAAMRRAVVAGAHPSLEAKEDCYNILDQALRIHGKQGEEA